nr:ctg4a [Hymenolepis microstoma]
MLRYNATDSSEMLDYHGNSEKKIPYARSELRFTEILEDPSLCSNMLQYRLHNERKDSTRFQKSRPQTFETLKQLVDRGVDVKLDIPQSLWDSPSLEISMLKEKCEKLVSEYAEEIESWFFKHQDDASLLDYLCRNLVLKDLSSECLDEPMPSEYTSTTERSDKNVKNEL